MAIQGDYQPVRMRGGAGDILAFMVLMVLKPLGVPARRQLLELAMAIQGDYHRFG